MTATASSNIAIRIGVEGGDESKRQMQDVGDSGEKALQKIQHATEPASLALRTLNAVSGEVSEAFEGFTEHAGRIGSILSEIGPGGAIAASALGALVFAIHHTVEEAEAFEQSQRKLSAVLQATGHAAGLTQDDLTEMAEAAAHSTLFTSEQVQQAEAVLLTYKKIHSDVFEEVLKASLDASTLFGRDLTASARALGRAIEDPVNGLNALTRAGVAIDPVMKENIKSFVETGQQSEALKLILDALATSVGGQAEAQHAGLTGATHDLSTSFKELNIAFGQNISQSGTMQSAIKGLASAFTALREEVRPTVEEELKEVQARMKMMETAGTDSFFGQTITNPFYSNLEKQQDDLYNQLAKKREEQEQAKKDGEIENAKERAEAIFGIDKDLSGKVLDETQSEQDKILASASAFKQKIINQLAPDGSNQADIDKELELNEKLKSLQLDKANAAQAQEALKLAEANQKVIDTLQKRVDLEKLNDPRQQAIQGETDKLNDSATQEQIDQAKQLAAALYDDTEAHKAATAAAEAHDKAIAKINLELAKNKTSFDDAKQGIDQWRDQLMSDLGGATEANEKYAAEVQQIYDQKLKDAYYKSLQDSKDWSDGAISALHKYADEASNTAKISEQVFSTAAKDIEDSLTNVITTGKINMQQLSKMIQTLEQDMLHSFIKQNITAPGANYLSKLLQGGAGGGTPDGGGDDPTGFGDDEEEYGDLGGGGDAGSSSIFGSIFSSIFHSGGTVGQSLAGRRALPAWAFAGAPRLHSGLAPDEFPAILQRGETVIPKNQRGAGMHVTMNISTPNAQSFMDAKGDVMNKFASQIQRYQRRNG